MTYSSDSDDGGGSETINILSVNLLHWHLENENEFSVQVLVQDAKVTWTMSKHVLVLWIVFLEGNLWCGVQFHTKWTTACNRGDNFVAPNVPPEQSFAALWQDTPCFVNPNTVTVNLEKFESIRHSTRFMWQHYYAEL